MPESPKPSVRKHATIATIAVAGSRVMGLVREMIFAFFFGAGPVLDAFIAAFRIPNLLRDLFSEGALSNAFVTTFSKLDAKKGDREAWELANRVFSFLLIFLGIATVLSIIFAPWIVPVVASGFTGEKFEFTVYLTRLLFPFIIFVSMAAISMSMLNTKGKFALPQSASTFYNITSIIIGLACAYWMEPEFVASTFNYLFAQGNEISPSWQQASHAITGMAYGTLFGGLVQWAVQMPALYKMGFRFRPTLKLKDKGLKQVLKLTGPAIIGGAAVQINVLVNTNFASYLADGSIAWLNFAFRMMQFPIGVFGVAVALATTPAIARMIAKKETNQFRKTFRDSTQMMLFLCIPSAFGLIILAKPILSLIYQHGQFTAHDTLESSYALMAYASGLIFYAIIKVFQPAFIAHNDARTPMIISLISIGINVVVNWFLVFKLNFAHWGLALGTSTVALWNAVMLTVLLRKKISGIWTATLWKQIIKITIAAAISCAGGYLTYLRLLHFVGDTGIVKQLILVFGPIAVTTLFYFLFCSFFGVNEAKLIREQMRKKLGRS